MDGIDFYDEYIDELIRQEIEIEKRVFFENKSPFELELIAALSEALAREIDNEILKDLTRTSSFGANSDYIVGDTEVTQLDSHSMNVNVQLVPRQQFITLNIDINGT